MPWLFLTLAGLLEIGWAVGLKASDGFTRLVPSAITVVCFTASLVLLGLATRTLPIGTAYAVWTGIGIVGTTIFGMAFFGEAASVLRLGAVALILVGIAGLKLTG